jgi:hypothetical protein
MMNRECRGQHHERHGGILIRGAGDPEGGTCSHGKSLGPKPPATG